MGLFDDLLIAESDEYITIFSYVEYLATEYDSSVIATISYLLKSNIESIYYNNRGGVYDKDDDPKAVELALKGLLNNLYKKISNAICSGDQQSELEMFLSMWDYENYGLFKKTELPIISAPTYDQPANPKNQPAQALTDVPADEQPQGIAKYNADKAIYIATGKALAGYIWSMDTTKAIRTGDMVQQVRQVMHSINPKLLPDDKAIRSWLSDIAPQYAKKGGQPPNNAPNEIPLTMKK